MEGGEMGGYGKMEGFQPDAQNSSAAGSASAATAVSGADASAATAGSGADASAATAVSGADASAATAASGVSAAQGNMPQGMGGMHGEGGQGGSFSAVLLTIARFFSIAYIFAFIAGLIDFILGRRK
jgi:hypothetical protein